MFSNSKQIYQDALQLFDSIVELILFLWILGIGAQLIVQHRLTKEILLWPIMWAAKIVLSIVSLFTMGERKRR